MTASDALLHLGAADLVAMDRGALETARRRFLEDWFENRPDKITQLGTRLARAGTAGVDDIIAWAAEAPELKRIGPLSLYLMGAWDGFDQNIRARPEDVRKVLALRDALDLTQVSDYLLLMPLAAAGAKPDIRPLVEAPVRQACEALDTEARRELGAALDTYFAMS